MLKVLTVALIASLAQTTLGQIKYISSPKGFLTTEGNTHFYLTTGGSVNRRYMAIDNTLLTTVASFKSFALRRDTTSTAFTNVGSSSFTVALNMGVGNFARLHQICDDNYVGPKTSVFRRQSVSFPDWRQRGAGPAPFDFALTLNQPYLYLGRSAFIWDLSFEGPSAGNRLTDRQYSGRGTTQSTVLGSGCVATGQSIGFMHYHVLQNSGVAFGRYGMRLIPNATWAPPQGNVLMSVALKDANLAIPGWCARLRAQPLLLLDLGKADMLGKIRNQYWSFPYSANVVNQRFVTQLIARDPKAPNGLVLSNGAMGSMPAATSNASIQAAYIWSNHFNAPSRGGVFFGGSYIARLGY